MNRRHLLSHLVVTPSMAIPVANFTNILPANDQSTL